MTKDNSKIDYGASLKKGFPRNPMLIHRIQDKLHAIDPVNLMMSGLLGTSIMAYRYNAMPALIGILAQEDRQKVIALIGEETMKDIDEYMQGEDSDDLGDLYCRERDNIEDIL